VPNPDRDEAIRAAAGERIVAFARPGKPPKIPFTGKSDRLRPARIREILARPQRFLKPHGVALWF
jgi:hypothetical protein